MINTNYQIVPATLKDAEFSGKGFGEIVITHVESLAKEQKCTVMKIEAMGPAERLIYYYEKIGYQPKKKIDWKDVSRATLKANYTANSYYLKMAKILATIGASWAFWLCTKCFFTQVLPFMTS